MTQEQAKPAPTTAETDVQLRDVRRIETDRQVCRIRFSPDGQLLFGGGYDSLIRRWDLTADEPKDLTPLAGHQGWVQSIEFLPDGQTLVSVDSWGRLCAWPFLEESPQPNWQRDDAHDGWIRDLTVSRDGSLLVTAGRDRAVRIWAAADGALVTELPRHEHDLCRVAMHPNSKSVVSSDLLGTLRHWDLASGSMIRELKLEKMHFYDRIQDVPGICVLQFDDAGEQLICAGGQPTRIGNHQGIPTIHHIDWANFTLTATQSFGEEKDGFIFDLTQHPDGYYVAVTSGNPGAGQLLLIRPEAEEPFVKYSKMSNCHSAALHPNNQTLVVAATNRSSQGNGAVRDKAGNYLGNSSPLHVFELGGAEQPKPA